MKAVKDDLTGKRFGMLTIVEYSHTNKSYRSYWVCKCDCGNTKTIARASLIRTDKSASRSCGCTIKRNPITHNKSYSRLYTIWTNMKQRCSNPKNTHYDNYGGRGISVCEEWKNDFNNFHEWAMNNGYNETLTIDRVNNDGNYEPTNCRWATAKEQANNTRPNKGWFKKHE